MNGFYRVHGWLRFLYAEPAFPYEGLDLTASYGPGGGQAYRLDEPNTAVDPSQFTLEADYFSDCILQDKTPKTAGKKILRHAVHVEDL